MAQKKQKKGKIVKDDVAVDDVLLYLFKLVDPTKKYLTLEDMIIFDKVSYSNPEEIVRRALHTLHERALSSKNGKFTLLALRKLDYLDSNIFLPEYLACIDSNIDVRV